MIPGLYVYGVVETGSPMGPPGRAGITGDAPVLFDVDGLAAIVSRVDVTQFEGDALERNAATPQWLEEKVRAHEAVLEDALEHTTVVPMRFGAILSSADALRRMLVEHGPALREALARVRGRTEWGVKVHRDAGRLLHSTAGTPPDASSGRDYLQQKKALLEARERAAEDAAAVATAVHRSLTEVSDEAVLGTGSDEILNGAYLVRDDERETFMRRVADLGRRYGDAFVFEVTGPWPPYNFTSADVGGPRP